MIQICKQQSIITTQEVASDFLFDSANTLIKHFSSCIVVYLVKVFMIATAFQEFTFIVKYCCFTSTFGAHSFFEEILLVFRTYEYQKNALKWITYMNDITNTPK